MRRFGQKSLDLTLCYLSINKSLFGYLSWILVILDCLSVVMVVSTLDAQPPSLPFFREIQSPFVRPLCYMLKQRKHGCNHHQTCSQKKWSFYWCRGCTHNAPNTSISCALRSDHLHSVFLLKYSSYKDMPPGHGQGRLHWLLQTLLLPLTLVVVSSPALRCSSLDCLNSTHVHLDKNSSKINSCCKTNQAWIYSKEHNVLGLVWSRLDKANTTLKTKLIKLIDFDSLIDVIEVRFWLEVSNIEIIETCTHLDALSSWQS